ncbi:Uncharacterized ACR, COG1430 [Brevinema andersonii]|uniref:Uncharacterized ACR, COG1430 n=1 Tax=Brevinema andersonii TaxID=34097 RepID=A0A1I1DWE6_BREAD|nr:DUF192 domain-containing protein [Brevinema andersonii]SFB77348.1 Uncharacterized ACR, COG1430 [Brevinema andersonii]
MKTALMISFLFLGQTFNIELAINPVEQATGLMYRLQWDDSFQGMLFINKAPKQVSFWMKNTYLNLIMLYLDSNFNIVELHRPVPYDSRSIVSKTSNIQYVLELNPKYEMKVIQNWHAFKVKLEEEVAIATHNVMLYR